MSPLKNLSDDQLLDNLSRLNSAEVDGVADVLAHLIEVDRRKLYAARGYSSLFEYCVVVLKYCDGSAGRRVNAARCIEKYPELYDLFKRQEITLTTISLISKILTAGNRKTVLNAVCGRRTSEVEKYVASYLPARTIRERIKPLPPFAAPPPPTVTQPVVRQLVAAQPVVRQLVVAQSADGQSMNAQSATTQVARAQQLGYSANGAGKYLESQEKIQPTNDVPQTEVDFEIKLRARSSAVKKLRRVQALRGKKETLGELLEVLLDDYLAKHAPEAREIRREKRDKKRTEKLDENSNEQLNEKLDEKPSEKRSSIQDESYNIKRKLFESRGRKDPRPRSISRYISRRTRDKIYERDRGRCAYVAPDGTRCSCTRRLQVDHIRPFAQGGSSEDENLRLLCPAHNAFVADLAFGRERMERKRRRIVQPIIQPSGGSP